MKNITIYSTPTCHFCHMAKDYFKANNLSYTEKDVASDPKLREELVTKSGQLGVPVIFIDNEMVIGFNQSKIAQLLGL